MLIVRACLFHSDESSYVERCRASGADATMTQATRGPSDNGGADAVAAQEHITLYVSIIEAKVIALRSGQDVQPMFNASRWGLKRACTDPRTLDDLDEWTR